MSAGWLGPHPGRHDSTVHRLPTPPKLVVALVLIAGTVGVPLSWRGWFAGVAILLAVTTVVSRIPPLFLLRRLLLLSPFVLGVALVNALEPSARGTWIGVAIRGVLSLLTVLLVANTTQFSGILRVLRSVRVPALLITTMALMHRYLFVLADEAGRMRVARASRTFTPGRRFHWKALATVAGQLFVRASGRAERIYDAMSARGWQ